MYLFITPSFLPTVAGTECELAKLASTVGKENCLFILPSYLKNEEVNATYRIVYFPRIILRITMYVSKKIGSVMFRRYILNRINLRDFKKIFLIFIEPTLSLANYLIEEHREKTVLVPQGGDVKKALIAKSKYSSEGLTIYYMSDSMKADLVSLGFNASSLKYVPTGTDFEYLRSFNRKESRESLRYLDVFPEDLVLLTVARNVPKKRLFDIPRILELLPSDLPIKWIIVGQGAGNIQSNDRLMCLPPIRVTNANEIPSRELVTLYAGADLYVITSESEGLSLVTLDQLAIGNPIIGYDGDGEREIFSDGESLPNVGDVRGMATLIETFYYRKQSPELITSIEDFSCINVSKKYFSL